MSTTTTSTNATSTVDLSQVVIPTFTPKFPDEPATDGQIALMKELGLRTPSGMTQGQASARIHRFFVANPAIYVQREEEKRAKRKASWEAKVKEYLALAKSRSAEACRVPASEPQIRAMMQAVFVRRDVPEHLVNEGRQLLNYGALGAYVSVFLDSLPPRADDAAGQQPN